MLAEPVILLPPLVPGLLLAPQVGLLVPVKPWPRLPAELGGASVEEAARDDPRDGPSDAPETGDAAPRGLLERGVEPREESGASGGLGTNGAGMCGSGEHLVGVSGHLGGFFWRPIELPKSEPLLRAKTAFTSSHSSATPVPYPPLAIVARRVWTARPR